MAKPHKALVAARTMFGCRAAQYLRASTEMQCYSLEHQAAAIAAYADERDISIVRTYSDGARSGVTTRGRKGLRTLLEDVEAGAPYALLLIYDVSRWGRYQDPDEAAYYEHLCRSKGVRIVYCAEIFEDDDSPLSAMLKALKRAMAAEFSRDLSAKVSLAKRRLAAKGYLQGGAANYGLRRRLFDEQGVFIRDLSRGEEKAVRAHRVVLVPGPKLEVAIVRLIYWFFVERGLGPYDIAARINSMGLPKPGAPWNGTTIGQLLRNPRYAGDLLYGRVRRTMRGKPVPTDAKTWVRVAGAIEPIIDREIFDKAQLILRTRAAAKQAIGAAGP